MTEMMNNMAGHAQRFLKIVDASRTRIKECTVKDIHERMESGETFYLVDVREDREWERSHLPNAVHIGKGVIERDIETKIPDTDAEIVLYCGGGYRSALAADALQQMGYRNVCSMDGGFRGWNEAGYSVEVSEA